MKKFRLLALALFSLQLWSGEYIADTSSYPVINLDREEGREDLRRLLSQVRSEGAPVVLEYSAQYDVSNLQIHIPLAGRVGRVLGHIPLVGGFFNRIFQEIDPPKTLTLRALLFPAKNPKGFLLGVHGLQSNSTWYAKTGIELARKGVTSLFYDRRGSGLSDSVVDANGKPMRGHVASSSLDHLLSGPLDRALGDASEFLEDIQVSYEHLHLVRELQNSTAPLHLYANCFGARVAYAYANEWDNPTEAFASIITTSPGTNMKKGEMTSLGSKAHVLLPVEGYQQIQLIDKDFTSNPEALQEMGDDDMSLTLRKVTNRFLLSAAGLTKKMKAALQGDRLANVPTLVMIPSRDEIIYTEETHATFAQSYSGPTLVAWLNSEHMIEFDPAAQADFAEILSQWIHNSEQNWAGYKGPANFLGQLQMQRSEGQLSTLIPEKSAAYR